MTSSPSRSGLFRHLLRLPALALLGGSYALAQLAAPAAPTPAQLEKYDLNRNGALEADEVRAMEAAEAKTAADGEVLELSPFHVVADTTGYLASNTMSGTRLRSDLKDLGASITVVTKQQLLDTAALDINDVFQFEANTEGTASFTNQSVDFQGRVIDNVQASPYTSNRIRGLTAANVSIDGFNSNSRIPFDTYNIDSVEISRGPNSSLSGLGDPAGTVNVNQSRANLRRSTTQLTLRGDDWGGYRSSLDFNRPLIKDKLAIRASALYDSKGFRRKPAEDIQKRQFVAVTFKPFESTSLSGSVENYRQFRRTPNALTPTDMVTPWLNNPDRPIWDPVTSTAKRLANGSVIGVYASSNNENSAPPVGLPSGLGRDAFFDNYPSLFIESDGSVPLYMVNRLQASGAIGTADFAGNQRLMTTYSDIGRFRNTGNGSTSPLSNLVGVSNRDIYDWENINIAAPNWNRDKATSYKVQLEQRLFNTKVHKSFLQVAWRREDYESYRHSELDETTNIYIDVNERLLDGSANPYFLRPYINGIQKSFSNELGLRDTGRAQVSYDLDLREQGRGWLQQLGHHRALAYVEQSALTVGRYVYRTAVTSDAPWINSADRFASKHGNVTFRYYLGDNQGYDIDYAPASTGVASGAYDFRYATNAATNPPAFTTTTVNIDDAAFGGLTRSADEVRTRGASLQSFFWHDRIVTTLGWRRDRQRTRSTSNAVIDPATGFGSTSNYDAWNAWTEREGDTSTYQGVIRPFTGSAFARRLQQQSGFRGFLGDLFNGLQFHGSYADSFKPDATAVNIFGEALANPHGKGMDYGFSVSLLDDKLVARVNWYDATSYGARLVDQFNLPVILTFQTEVGDTTRSFEGFLRDKIRQQNPTASTAQVETMLYQQSGVPDGFYERFNGVQIFGGISDANDQQAKGVEIELNYNPTRNLRLKLAGAQTKTIDLTMIQDTIDFIEQRLPVWQAATYIDGRSWWTTPSGGPPPSARYTSQIANNIKNMSDNVGRPRTQIKEWTWRAIGTYRFTQGRLNGWEMGTTIRWDDKSTIGFEGIDPDGDGIVQETDFNRPVYDSARTSFDFMLGYNLRFKNNKFRARIQLNCKDAFSSRELRVTKINPTLNGSEPSTFRIIDGRQWVLTTSFDL